MFSYCLTEFIFAVKTMQSESGLGSRQMKFQKWCIEKWPDSSLVLTLVLSFQTSTISSFHFSLRLTIFAFEPFCWLV